MAKKRVINTHFWDDTYVIDLDPTEKLLFLYLLTNPCTDICGAYEINLRRIALDTGIDREMLLKILGRFEAAGKITYKDGWILIHNFVKNQTQNPSVHLGIARSLKACPDWIRDTLIQTGNRLPQPVLLNLTLPNLTSPNGGGEEYPQEPKERKEQSKPSSLAKSLQAEIDTWLDALAGLTGAKSRKTMANAKRWRETVEKAVVEQIDMIKFLGVAKDEITNNLKYFTPENVLKLVQASNGNGTGKSKWMHDV